MYTSMHKNKSTHTKNVHPTTRYVDFKSGQVQNCVCKRIVVFELSAYRCMFKFFWTMKVTSQQTLRRVQLKKACRLADIRKMKMGYFGHIIRHGSALRHALSEGKLEGRRCRCIILTVYQELCGWGIIYI